MYLMSFPGKRNTNVKYSLSSTCCPYKEDGYFRRKDVLCYSHRGGGGGVSHRYEANLNMGLNWKGFRWFLCLFLSDLCSCSYLCLLVNLCHLFILQLSVLIRISIFFVNCNITYSMAYQELKCTFFFKSLRYKRKLLPKRKFMLLFPKRLNLHPKVLVIYSKFKIL